MLKVLISSFLLLLQACGGEPREQADARATTLITPTYSVGPATREMAEEARREP